MVDKVEIYSCYFVSLHILKKHSTANSASVHYIWDIIVCGFNNGHSNCTCRLRYNFILLNG